MVSDKVNENIMQTTVQLITYKLKDVFYNLINDMCDLYAREDNGEIPSELIPAVNKVRKYAHRLSEELNKSLDEREDYIKELNALKKEYVSQCLPLILQMQAMENLKSHTEYVLACNALKDEDDKEYHNISHMIYEHMGDFLHSKDDKYSLNMIMGFIASKLPLRMTRENYTDRIRNGFNDEIETMQDNTPREILSAVEFNCFPQLCKGFKDIFGENAEKIESLYAENISPYGTDELDEYANRVDEIFEDMFNATESLNIAYNDINYMLALAAYTSNEDLLTDDDPVIRDALYSCREMLEGHDPELIYESLSERMTELIENNFGVMRETEEKQREYADKYQKDDIVEDAANLIGLYNNINTLYYLEISDEARYMCRADEELESEDPLEEIINITSEAAKRYAPGKSKFFRKQVFNYIPLVMNMHEFTDYYNYCIDPHNPSGENKVALADVFNLLYQEDPYLREDNDEDLYPEELINGEHCDCGHHHHHDEHCGCGHHHHHGS